VGDLRPYWRPSRNTDQAAMLRPPVQNATVA
jgi:hypothetical protein